MIQWILILAAMPLVVAGLSGDWMFLVWGVGFIAGASLLGAVICGVGVLTGLYSLQEYFIRLIGESRHNAWLGILICWIVFWAVVGFGVKGPMYPLNNAIPDLAAEAQARAFKAVSGTTDEQIDAALHIPVTKLSSWVYDAVTTDVERKEEEKDIAVEHVSRWWKIFPFLLLAFLPFWASYILFDDMRALAVAAFSFVMQNRYRSVMGTATVGSPEAATAIQDHFRSQKNRTDWQRWLSPAWWLEYMADDLLSEFIADGAIAGLRQVMTRAVV